MDNREEQYGQRGPVEDRPYKYSMEGAQPQGRGDSGMADQDVSISKLQGLDVMGASAAAIMMLGPLAAVAIGMN